MIDVNMSPMSWRQTNTRTHVNKESHTHKKADVVVKKIVETRTKVKQIEEEKKLAESLA